MTNTTIQIDEQVCIRLGAFANEQRATLSDAISRLLDESAANATRQGEGGTLPVRPQVVGASLRDLIVYSPAGEENFKHELLRTKVAYIRLHYADGRIADKCWRANNISENSDVYGNLSSGYLRHWREKRICKAEVSIEPFKHGGSL